MKIFCPKCKQLDCQCPPVGRRARWLARLSPVELFLEDRRVVAATSANRLNRNQASVVYALLPTEARSHPEVAARWELAHVICLPEWAAKQLARVPMLPPNGEKVLFV